MSLDVLSARAAQAPQLSTWSPTPGDVVPPHEVAPTNGFAANLANRKLEENWCAPFFEQFLEGQQINRPGDFSGVDPKDITQAYPSDSDHDILALLNRPPADPREMTQAYPSDTDHDINRVRVPIDPRDYQQSGQLRG